MRLRKIYGKLSHVLPDCIALEIMYFYHFRRFFSLRNPKTFNEKLQWLKLHDRKPEYTTMVDKYAVCEYIAQTIGKEYLIPLLGVWDSVDEIDYDALPDQFVLKCNHDSQSVVICKDKDSLDWKRAKEKLAYHLAQNGYWYGREWPYKNVKPLIICEEYIGYIDNVPDDYKILCFNGEPKVIEYHHGRFSEKYVQNYYKLNGELFGFNNLGYVTDNSIKLDVSITNRMISLAKILSKGIPHVRVDFYYVQGKVFFGEMTFFDGSGFASITPEEWDYSLGKWIKLP
ncbi:ATP-grasp fold amidoligase family protein [Eubacterium aggregans]|uniref:ATP-grasp fold amidoligase family protein n=1 Tax=Eubacterium aggregans TaxID=81409 RepID=UPI003F2A13CB